MPNVRGVLAGTAVAALIAGGVLTARVVAGRLPAMTASAGPTTTASATAAVPAAAWLANPAPPAGAFTTVALDSFAQTPDGRRAAAQRVRALRAAGFEAAALDSSRYSSLEPGFLLVYSGVFPGTDLAAARRRAAALRAARVTRAGYARHVSCWNPCSLPVDGLR